MRSRGLLAAITAVASCGAPAPNAPYPPAREVTPAAATRFLADADAELRTAIVGAAVAEWANETDITPAHEAGAAAANGEMNGAFARLIKRARTFEPIAPQLDATSQRLLHVLIYNSLVAIPAQPAPDDPKQATRMAEIAEKMTSIYGGGEACDADHHNCRDLEALSEVLQTSHDPNQLLAAWKGWRDAVGRAERSLFREYVPLANAGARAVGFRDTAQMWQAGYDMPPDAFAAETERLWKQVEPLYRQLHCYTRRKLNARYGDAVAPKTGLIPAHLLGNMWSQTWGYLYPDLEPVHGIASADATPALAAGYDAAKMFRFGEAFYTSLGMDSLPDTFWQRSMLSKPDGKKVVCHASAWDVQYANDLRIKMCVRPTHEDLVTIHHELGHDYYFHSYYRLPMLFQNGANDGFHEAIGDTIALSVTPAYLKQKGLISAVDTSEGARLDHLMRVALDKIAFLPFGLMVDRWRWDAFSGAVSPDHFNAHWWELAAKYQGIAPPVERSEQDFDPGAKYHVATNTPYMRYFLAAVLQFQFHRALCQKAGFTGPLSECSIYGNRAAGEAFGKMLALGASKPWQDALFELTGSREMDAGAILEYFAPLQAWLEAQNAGDRCGW